MMNFEKDLDTIENGINLLGPVDDIKEIYHYTGIEGIKAIIETGNLWVSHSYFMNDPTEIKHTYELVIEELEKTKKLETENKEMYDILRLSMEFMLKKEVDEDFIINRSKGFRPSEYILSFSLNSDSLQLWSAFTGGQGYNIGLDFKELNKIFNTNKTTNCIAGKVIYDLNKQQEILREKIRQFKDVYIKYADSFNDDMKQTLSNKFVSI